MSNDTLVTVGGIGTATWISTRSAALQRAVPNTWLPSESTFDPLRDWASAANGILYSIHCCGSGVGIEYPKWLPQLCSSGPSAHAPPPWFEGTVADVGISTTAGTFAFSQNSIPPIVLASYACIPSPCTLRLNPIRAPQSLIPPPLICAA